MSKTPKKTAGPFEEIAAALPTFEEEQAMSLRQAGARDPLPGCPMEIRIGDETHLVEPGQWQQQGFADRYGLPVNCPVVPLGKDGSVCYLLDTMGGVAELDARSSGKGPIGFIFGGRSRFLEWGWPRMGRARKGEKPPVLGWEADDARQALVDACSWRGYFALEDQVRGRGAWRDDDGSLIFHAGDEVWIGGKWRPCGVHGRFIYPARPKIGRPATRSQPDGADGPGENVLDLLKTFNWDRGELDAKLMLGWLMTAKVGGALDRRPVGFVTGAEGSGKSTLQALLRVLLNGALIATSNTTQAGIYQRLQQDSVAIMVDEMEAKDDTRTTDKILELARIAYSGDKMQRGGKDGVGKEFALNSSFLGSSIAKPATDSQDDSRMVVFLLRERKQAGGKLDVDHATLDELGKALSRRFFDWWPRWEVLMKAFRETLIAAGHSDRSSDTFAPLAAASHVALHDELPTAEDLKWWAEKLAADKLSETANREKTWQRCFNWMLETQPEVFRHNAGKKRSVADYLDAFKADPKWIVDCNENFPLVGLALSFPEREPETFDNARLFVPANHAATAQLFEGTPWAGRPATPGPWANALRHMPEHCWENGRCGKGLGEKKAGMFIKLAEVLKL